MYCKNKHWLSWRGQILTFLSAVLLLSNLADLQAQDPIYSQFYASPLQLNPAFAGNSNDPTFYLHYRNQWPSIEQAYTTYSASYDQYFPKYASGLGLSFLSDNAGNGILKNLRVSGIYSYKLQMRNNFNLKFGLEASFVQHKLDWDKLIFADQIDPSGGPIFSGGTLIPSTEVRPDRLSNNYFDLSTGFLLYNPLFYLGLSLEHLNNPSQSFLDSDETFIGLPTRISLHFGTQINFDSGNNVDEGSFITPNALLAKQGEFYQLNVGFYSKIKVLLGGLWFRHTFGNADALIFSIGTKYNVMKIQYSFDYTVSGLSIDSGGAHELSFKYILEGVGEQSSKINDCLSIFR